VLADPPSLRHLSLASAKSPQSTLLSLRSSPIRPTERFATRGGAFCRPMRRPPWIDRQGKYELINCLVVEKA
jgi:hypothetical protein